MNRRRFFGVLAASPAAMLPQITEAAPQEDGYIEDGEFFSYRVEVNGKNYYYPTYTEITKWYDDEFRKAWDIEKDNFQLKRELEKLKAKHQLLLNREYKLEAFNAKLLSRLSRLIAINA